MWFLQETFLRKDDGAHLNEIREQGLKVHSVPRTDGREHGGIAVVYLPNIKLKPLKLSKNDKLYKTFEHFESVFKSNMGLIRIVNVYQPTYSVSHRYTIKDFLEEFEKFLVEALVVKSEWLATLTFM